MKEHPKTFNFTKKSIDALPFPETGRRFYFYDTKVRGLELMITPQGAKSFKVYRRFHHKPLRITLGKYPDMTVENARRDAQNIMAELNAGKNPNEEKKKLRK